MKSCALMSFSWDKPTIDMEAHVPKEVAEMGLAQPPQEPMSTNLSQPGDTQMVNDLCREAMQSSATPMAVMSMYQQTMQTKTIDKQSGVIRQQLITIENLRADVVHLQKKKEDLIGECKLLAKAKEDEENTIENLRADVVHLQKKKEDLISECKLLAKENEKKQGIDLATSKPETPSKKRKADAKLKAPKKSTKAAAPAASQMQFLHSTNWVIYLATYAHDSLAFHTAKHFGSALTLYTPSKPGSWFQQP